MSEKKAVSNSERVQKCLSNNYKQVKVNVRLEKYDIWKQYIDSKGISFYALITQLIDKAIEEDNFLPESKKEQ